MKLHPNAKNLEGMIFGRLTVIGVSANRRPGDVAWDCRCACGVVISRTTARLLYGKTSSCGCYRRDRMALRPRLIHGAARDGHITREYAAWRGMLHRCRSSTSAAFHRYAGRGITVCDRWNNFQAFITDMGPCPDGYSLERINNDGNYEPANCRWATQHEQTRNQERTRRITFSGKTMCLSDWAIEVGIPRDTLTSRIVRYGWSAERALSTPVHTKFRRK